MVSRKNRPTIKKSNDFYWEGPIPDSKLNLIVLVSVKTLAVNKLTESYYKQQIKNLRTKIHQYFHLDKMHITDEDAYNNLLLSLISQYPPSHVLSVGYRTPNTNKENITTTIFFSLEFLRDYNLFYVIKFIGRFITNQILEDKSGYSLINNEQNEEFYIQCLRAVCKKVLDKDK